MERAHRVVLGESGTVLLVALAQPRCRTRSLRRQHHMYLPKQDPTSLATKHSSWSAAKASQIQQDGTLPRGGLPTPRSAPRSSSLLADGVVADWSTLEKSPVVPYSEHI